MAKIKRKSIFRKISIVTSILSGIFIITYSSVKPVRDSINKIVGIIFEVSPEENIKIEKLEAVTNVSYDEKTRTLTFKENLKAKNHVVVVNHVGTKGYLIETNIGQVEIYGNNVLLDGDIIRFEVTAKGDNYKTKDSNTVVYEYEMKFANQSVYDFSKYRFERFIKESAEEYSEFRMKFFEAKSFNIDGDYLIIEGTGKSGGGNDVNFSIKYNITEFAKGNSIDFTNLNNYSKLISYMNRNTSKYSFVEAKFADDFIDLTKILEENGQFDDYINSDYRIEVLQYSNTEVLRESGANYIIHTAIYQAVHESKPTITFKQINKIKIQNDKNYENVLEFLEDAKIESVLTTESRQIYDHVLNDHLKKTLEADSSKIKTG